MIGDAVPIRFSKRIQRKASLSPVRVSLKKKTRRSALKKKAPGANSSLLKATGKTKVGRKSKSEKDPKQTSGLNSSLLKVGEKTTARKKSKSENNSKHISEISRRASNNLKPATHKRSREDISKIFSPKRKTKNSLNASQVELTANEKQQNLEFKLSDERKKVIKKKSCTKFTGYKKQSVRRSLRVSKSSLLAKEKEINKELNDSKLKLSRQKKPTQKKCSLEVASINSKSVFTKNTGKSKRTIRHSSRFSTESSNQEISLLTPTSKSLPVTPYPLRTLNKELSLTGTASVLRKNQDSMINKFSKLSKSAELLAVDSRGRKRVRPRVSKKGIATYSWEKLKPSRKRQVDQQKAASENFIMPLSKGTENLPLDVLSTPAFTPIHVRSISKKCVSKSSKRKYHDSPTENRVASKEVPDVKKRKKSADFSNVPVKGTLKHKRWLLNNLKEKNTGYEDDIFENQNFGVFNKAFHFGDESDGSSVNIATPKFETILTPALPKKTPRFKDCISPTELLEARKTAEEYLHRRNKKRKSGDRPSSSGKKTSTSKKNITQSTPERKRLDFEEAVNKLIAVQKDLEKDAEVDDEEEDSYFSDASN